VKRRLHARACEDASFILIMQGSQPASCGDSMSTTNSTWPGQSVGRRRRGRPSSFNAIWWTDEKGEARVRMPN